MWTRFILNCGDNVEFFAYSKERMLSCDGPVPMTTCKVVIRLSNPEGKYDRNFTAETAQHTFQC